MEQEQNDKQLARYLALKQLMDKMWTTSLVTFEIEFFAGHGF